MKKIYKFIGYLCTLGMVFSVPTAMAGKVNEISWSNPSSYDKNITCCEVANNISMKDEKIVKEAEFSEKLKGSGYKYTKVIRNISYLENKTKNPLAMVCIEMNYRYNPITFESECISSSSNNIIYNNNYNINIVSKSLNKNIEVGSNVTVIDFRYLNQAVSSEVLETDCDYLGQLKFNKI